MTSFFSFGIQERLGPNNPLIKIEQLLNWSKIRSHLKGIHKNDIDPEGGPKSYDHIKMFKALLLGQWHSLSDAALENTLRVRLDFMAFTGFELLEDIPDETTICRFRNKIIAKRLDKKLFNEINSQLEMLGLKVEKAQGAVIDATIIESTARPKRVLEPIACDRKEPPVKIEYKQTESVDSDARWLKKGNRSYFGYKGFIVTDDKNGFIQQVHVTPANVSEMGELKTLIDEIKSERVLADKGYASKENREILKRSHVKDGIMRKAARNRPLTFWEKVMNKLISRRRFIVEQAFGTLKRKFLFRRASYRSRIKVEGQFRYKAMCFNLLKAINKVKLA